MTKKKDTDELNKEDASNLSQNEKASMAGNSAELQRKTYFEEREEREPEVKAAVAQHIVENFLEEGDSILLDAGTSLYPIASHIVTKTKAMASRTHYTVMTHNFRAFQILTDAHRDANLNIVLAGGRYDTDLNALFGPQTILTYRQFFPRVVLIGASGFSAKYGLFCHGNTEELSLKEEIIRKPCRDRIVILDHTKVGVQDSLCFGGIGDLQQSMERCIIVIGKSRGDVSEPAKRRYENELNLLRQEHRRIQIVEV